MTWKGIRPTIELPHTIYGKWVHIAKKACQQFEERLERDESLPKYSGQIQCQGAWLGMLFIVSYLISQIKLR